MNAEKDDGPALREQYSVPGYPTYVVLNAQAQTLQRWSGYSKESFLARAGEVAKDPTTIEEKMARLSSKPTEADAAIIARYQDSKGQYKEAIEHYRKAAALSGGANDYRSPIFEASFTGWQDDLFTLDELAAAADEYFRAEPDAGELLTPARMMAHAANKEERPDLAAPYVKQAIESSQDVADEDQVRSRKRLLPDYAMIVLKDEKKAVQYKKDSLPEGWKDDAEALNAFSWWCFENDVNLKEAQELAARGVELSPPGAEKAMILDTLAEIQNARGKASDAVVTMQAAVREDPNRESYKTQLRRFQAILAKGGK